MNFNMEITTKIGCRNNCIYCPQPLLIARYRKRTEHSPNQDLIMSFETFKTCMDKLPTNVNIDFSGMAEPWLNPRCTDMVEYAFATGHTARIYTTLVGMTPGDIERLEQYEYPGDWGFIVHLAAEEKIEHIPVTEQMLDTLKRLLHGRLRPLFHTHGKRAAEALEKLVGADRIRSVQPNDISGFVKWEGLVPPIDKTHGIITCNRIKSNVLLPNGDVVLCCHDYGMTSIIGNLLTEDYQSLYKSEAFRKVLSGFQDDSVDSICRHCHFAKNVDWKAKKFNHSDTPLPS